MRFFGLAALALLLLSVESVLVQVFGFEVTRIDVGLALVVFAALRLRVTEGALSAFAVGYLLDVITGKPTGLYPALAVLAFLLVRAAALLLDGRGRVAYLAFTGVATVVHALLALLLTWLTSRDGIGHVVSLSGVPLQVVLTVLAGAVLWPLLRRFEVAERPTQGGLL